MLSTEADPEHGNTIGIRLAQERLFLEDLRYRVVVGAVGRPQGDDEIVVSGLRHRALPRGRYLEKDTALTRPLLEEADGGILLMFEDEPSQAIALRHGRASFVVLAQSRMKAPCPV